MKSCNELLEIYVKLKICDKDWSKLMIVFHLDQNMGSGFFYFVLVFFWRILSFAWKKKIVLFDHSWVSWRKISVCNDFFFWNKHSNDMTSIVLHFFVGVWHSYSLDSKPIMKDLQNT